jgi:hypothetical protein
MASELGIRIQPLVAYATRSLRNNGSSELYSREEFFKKTSTGGILKAACLGEGQAVAKEGFGDSLLTGIEYRASSIETGKFLKFHFTVHIISYTFFKIRQVGVQMKAEQAAVLQFGGWN